MNTRRRITLCADDFGLSEPISVGIAALAARGRIQATGVMTAGPVWSGARELAADLPPDVAIGLHINLVEGQALSDSTPLPKAPRLAAGVLSGTRTRVWLEREITAQWDAFETRFARTPAFVDTHQHTHALAAVLEAMLAVGDARGERPPVRALHPAVGPASSRVKRWVLAALGVRDRTARLRTRGQVANAAFGGLQTFDRPHAVAAEWRELLAVIPDGALIACHPAAQNEPSDPIGAFRVAEYEWLGSDAFRLECAAAGVELASTNETPEPARRR